MVLTNNSVQFDPEIETVSEFLERFEIQCGDQIKTETAGGVQTTNKATVLLKALPVAIITDVQRGLKPKKLKDATYAEIETRLMQQFEVKKSIVAASVSFISRKQHAGESIEQYAQVLNNLAASCDYKECCRSRYLRDIFVAGLSSSHVISALLHQECDKMGFKDVVEKAKMIEAFSSDVQNIKFEKVSTHAVKSTHKTAVHKEEVPNSYVCIRCSARGKHFAHDCYALKMTCRKCNKLGHLAKFCKAKKGQSCTYAIHTHMEDDMAPTNRRPPPASWRRSKRWAAEPSQ